MGSYVPNTRREQEEMLRAIGLAQMSDLYADVPESVFLQKPLNLPEGMGEMQLRARMEEMASHSRVFPVILRGAGAYHHYIPSIVKTVSSREEFVTAYTPYQAEISQGILQSIFEYQTMMCELTGMDVSNASVYDGASAAAEAAAMCRDRKRTVTLISATVHPDTIATVRTYCHAAGTKVQIVPQRDGVTDADALCAMLTQQTACVIVQTPNFYGTFEPAQALVDAAHAAGAKAVLSCNPMALALMKTPGELGADYRRRGGAASGNAAELWRAVSGHYGGQTGDDAQAAGPHRWRDGGYTGQPRLCADAAGARATHPPREGEQQHLLQSGAVRADSRRISDGDGPGWAARGGAAVHGQCALPPAGAGAGRACARGKCALLPRICDGVPV